MQPAAIGLSSPRRGLNVHGSTGALEQQFKSCCSSPCCMPCGLSGRTRRRRTCATALIQRFSGCAHAVQYRNSSLVNSTVTTKTRSAPASRCSALRGGWARTSGMRCAPIRLPPSSPTSDASGRNVHGRFVERIRHATSLRAPPFRTTQSPRRRFDNPCRTDGDRCRSAASVVTAGRFVRTLSSAIAGYRA